MHSEKTFDADDNRSLKRRLVEEGRAHAALVYDGDEEVAWCEYGSSGRASRSSVARARGTASCVAPCPDRRRRRWESARW